MTKQTIIAIAIGILILVGAAGAFLYSQAKPKNSAPSIAEKQTTPTPNKTMTNSITELLSSGDKSKCSFETTDNDGITSGTIYTSGENARAEINTEVNNKETVAYLIKTGDTFYMWGEGIPMGIKMTMSVNDLSSRMQENDTFESFDPNKEVNFNCVEWTEDSSFFNPPTNIRFTSFGNNAPSSTSNTTITPTGSTSKSDTSNQCNICTSLTGAARTACLKQFNCQ